MSNYNNKKENRSIITKIRLMDLSTDRNGREFNRNSLLDILNDFDFSKISVPVSVYKNLVFGADKKGTIIVGHIKSYDAETETFELVIYSNSVNTINGFEDAIVCPRLFIDRETKDVRTILGFDVGPASFFAAE